MQLENHPEEQLCNLRRKVIGGYSEEVGILRQSIHHHMDAITTLRYRKAVMKSIEMLSHFPFEIGSDCNNPAR